MRRLLSVALVFLMEACSDREPAFDSAEYRIKQAQESVARRLRDPESARFSDVRVTEDGSVCGHVNGKNAFGAYAGAQPFLYVEEPYIEWVIPGGYVADEDIGHPTERGWETISFYDLYNHHCLGMSAERIAQERNDFMNAVGR